MTPETAHLGRGVSPLPMKGGRTRGSERPSLLGTGRAGGRGDVAAGLRSLPLPWESEEGWGRGHREGQTERAH